MVSAIFASRPQKKLVLFDVDETLTPARRVGRRSADRAGMQLN
jgi:phosphoserine phosphatase